MKKDLETVLRDPHHFYVNSYPDPAYHFDVDPDPDPTCHLMRMQSPDPDLASK
jgi:hypothetical protein